MWLPIRFARRPMNIRRQQLERPDTRSEQTVFGNGRSDGGYLLEAKTTGPKVHKILKSSLFLQTKNGFRTLLGVQYTPIGPVHSYGFSLLLWTYSHKKVKRLCVDVDATCKKSLQRTRSTSNTNIGHVYTKSQHQWGVNVAMTLQQY